MTKEEQFDGFRDDEKGIYPTGKIVKETKITLGDYPGREFEIEWWSGTKHAFARVYLVKEKSYHLRVSGDNTIKTATQAEVKTFFDSFKVNP